MAARIAVTKQLKDAYKRATKSEKSMVLDQFCASTGLARSSARRYLTSAYLGNDKVLRVDRRCCRPTKYSTEAKHKLLWLWRVMGQPCGKYLASVRTLWLDALESHGELVIGQSGWTTDVRDELCAMSAATIDRYLKQERQRLALKGISTTKAGALLRNSIQIRKAGDEVESEPGFFEVDTVAHCGPTLRGEFARTLSLTDVHTGWIQLLVVRNNAHANILAALNAAIEHIPFYVQGLDCDNGSEFMNQNVLAWAADKAIYFTRSRPYKKNDQAHIESKNNHAVRRYGFHYRYDTQEERDLLARLWELVCLKLNFFTATKKPVGWSIDVSGRRKRLYDALKTPLDRLFEADVLSDQQRQRLKRMRDAINPAILTRDILRYQGMLISLAAEKTDKLTEQVEQAREKRQHQLQGGVKIKTG